MIKPTDRFIDLFNEFPRIKRQMIGLNIGYALFFVPYLHRWFEKKTLEQTALLMKIDVRSVIDFINHKIAENTGCNDTGSINAECSDFTPGSALVQVPGFFKATESAMHKVEEFVKKTEPERIVYLDLSDLPAPEPLMKIREAISCSPPPLLVKATHRKVPVHLPGYLEDKPYYVYATDKNNQVVIYVFDRKLLTVMND